MSLLILISRARKKQKAGFVTWPVFLLQHSAQLSRPTLHKTVIAIE